MSPSRCTSKCTPSTRDHEEHFPEVICPEGSESSSQRLLFDLKSPVSQLEKDGDSTSRGQCMEC